MAEKTVSQLFGELSASKASFKFSAVGGHVVLSIDGLMHSLR